MKIFYIIVEKVGSYVMGTNFVKGDHIAATVEYFAKTAKGFVNLPRTQILKMLADIGVTNVKKITQQRLSLLRGARI